MELSGLEVVMGGAVLSGLVGLGTWVVTAAKYQTRSQCDERHAGVCREICALTARQDRDTGLVMRMLRSLIVHSNIPKDEQERILNDRSAS